LPCDGQTAFGVVVGLQVAGFDDEVKKFLEHGTPFSHYFSMNKKTDPSMLEPASLPSLVIV
jgi:hypothetical protein